MFKQLKKSVKFGVILLVSIILTLGFSLSLQSLLADWVAPNNTPPYGGIDDLVVGGNLAVGKMFAVSGSSTLAVDSGNVGIGTSTPTDKLEVIGIIKSTNLKITNGAGDGKVLVSDASGLASWTSSPAVTANIGTGTASFIPKWASSTAIDNSVIFQDVGERIGINTVSPWARLDVNGQVVIGSSTEVVSAGQNLIYGNIDTISTGTLMLLQKENVDKFKINHDGDVIAAGFFYSSDEKLKKEIKNINPVAGLEKLQKIQGVSFVWKDSGKDDYGFIAQDLEKIFPELVITNNDGLKSIKYASLIAPIVELVKMQQVEISDLRKENQLLEKRLEKLELYIK